MVKYLLVAVVTAATCFGISTAVGLGGRDVRSRAGGTYYDVYPGDSAEFHGAGLICNFPGNASGVVLLCGRPDTLYSVFVTFTGNWVRVWRSVNQGGNCCKTLLFQTRRNP
jgi:hypothetical protein